jgi:hypothetical protein
MLEEVYQFGVPQERLAGNAAPVQAEPANAVLLDYRGLHAELRGSDGGDIAAWTAAENSDVVSGH